MAWIPFSVAAPAGSRLPDDSVNYGPDIPNEADLRLLGDVSGKRVLDLGCGAGRNAVALARAGARTIAVDADAEQVSAARTAIDTASLKVELHHAPLAELAFLRADTVDAALSVHAIVAVDDVDRVFRQVHRVLRNNSVFVLSVPHPSFALVDPNGNDPLRIRHSAFDETPYGADDPRAGTRARSLATLFSALHRAGFAVDQVLEPQATNSGGDHWAAAMERVPPALIIRSRKQGI